MRRTLALLAVAALIATTGCRTSRKISILPDPLFLPGDSYDLKEIPSPMPGEIYTFQIRTTRNIRVTVGADVNGQAYTLFSREIMDGTHRTALSLRLGESLNDQIAAYLKMQGMPADDKNMLLESKAWLQPRGGEQVSNQLLAPLSFVAAPTNKYLVVTRTAKGQPYGKKRIIARWSAPNVEGATTRKGSGFKAEFYAEGSTTPLADDKVNVVQVFLIVDRLEDEQS